MAHIKNLKATTLKTIADRVDDAVFKDNVRHALLFFSTARSLGFPSFPTDLQEEELTKTFEHFVAIGRNISEQRKSDSGASITNFIETIEASVRESKLYFSFLKSFEFLFGRDEDGWYILKVKESIGGALKLLTEGFDKLVGNLHTKADDCLSRGDLSLAMLDELRKDYQLCELFSSHSPSVFSDYAMKFLSAGQKFKNLMMDISTTTKNKILTRDYDGILDDLKKFDANDPTIHKEVEEILRLVFKALSDQEKKIASSVLTYRFGATSATAIEPLTDELREIFKKLMLFIPYVSTWQDEINHIATGVNESILSICKKCKSGLDDVRLSTVTFNFLEAEEMIKSAECMLVLLKKLSDDIANARKVQEHSISKVSSSH